MRISRKYFSKNYTGGVGWYFYNNVIFKLEEIIQKFVLNRHFLILYYVWYTVMFSILIRMILYQQFYKKKI